MIKHQNMNKCSRKSSFMSRRLNSPFSPFLSLSSFHMTNMIQSYSALAVASRNWFQLYLWGPTPVRTLPSLMAKRKPARDGETKKKKRKKGWQRGRQSIVGRRGRERRRGRRHGERKKGKNLKANQLQENKYNYFKYHKKAAVSILRLAHQFPPQFNLPHSYNLNTVIGHGNICILQNFSYFIPELSLW